MNLRSLSKAAFLVVSIVTLILIQNSVLGKMLVLVFYVYGSVPFAFIFTYLLKGEIIYNKGTRNVGVANTFMIGGLPAGFLTVAGESSKAVFPLIITNFYFNGDLTTSLVLIFSAMLGTNFSIFLKGKGGMGTTILLWTLGILSPYSFLLFFAISILSFIAVKDSYRTSIIIHSLLPVVLFLTERSIPFAIFGLAASIMFISKYNRSRDDFEQHNVKKKLRRLLWKKGT